MIINSIRYIQFCIFRTPTTFFLGAKFYLYKKFSQLLNYFSKNKTTSKKNYNFFTKNGFFKYTNKNTINLADKILKKIKKFEKNDTNFWNNDGRPNLKDLRFVFPEIDQLFLGDQGKIVKSIFKSEFKIYYGVLNKNIGRKSSRTGSQLWHNDGGPGSCINMMLYLKDVNEDNGPLQIIDWVTSKKIFWYERLNLNKLRRSIDKDQFRKLRSNHINNIILSENHKNSINTMLGEKGTVIFFLNNTYHRGGYPIDGKDRMVMIFHLYPSIKPLSEIIKNHKSIDKTGAYPKYTDFNENFL